MNRIHRDVKKFMDAMRNQDTSQFFNDKKAGRYFVQLYTAFNEIIKDFRLVRIEKEVENQFYREVIWHSASGIMAISEDMQVKLVNHAALEVLGMDRLDHLSDLKRSHPELAEVLEAGDYGGQQLKLLANKKMVQLAVKATEMYLAGEKVRIYSLLDISREMDHNEIEAWQKLIRVLHHEITNSVVPLHILATSLFDLFHQGQQRKLAGDLDDETIKRAVLGLKTLVKRSKGLNDFINSYKSFTSIEEPSYSTFQVGELIRRVVSLLEAELEQKGVAVSIQVSPEDLQLKADETLIEQILINLLKNSLYALEGKETPAIDLKAGKSEKRLLLEVSDNGKGIPEELIDTIFTPFFTTRKGGTGIGLSLARQVMLMHNGAIDVSSKAGENTTFSLVF
jgi:nitrogen fixation/metabolism regulation signal transduction histidine kinase